MKGSFLDSNVLLYVASPDAAKASRAEALIQQGGTISVQVLNEVAHVARRKMAMDWVETRAFLAMLRDLLPIVPVTLDLHDQGLALAERHDFSVWDSMIVAAALHAGCDTLWTEDMQHGLLVAGRLRIADPFRTAA